MTVQVTRLFEPQFSPAKWELKEVSTHRLGVFRMTPGKQ